MIKPIKKREEEGSAQEMVKVLCVDDEKNVLRSLRRLFMDDGYEILTAGSAEEGLEILHADGSIQVVISDYRMPGMNGIDFLRGVCHNWPDTVRIVLSGYADTAAVVEAINDGEIYKFIPKPWNDTELRVAIQKAIERYFLKKKNRQLMDELKLSNAKLRTLNEALESVVKKALRATIQTQDLDLCRYMVEFLPRGIISIDAEGCIAHFNQGARELLDGTEADILGRPWKEVLPEVFHPFVKILDRQGLISEPCHFGGGPGWIRGSKIRFETMEGLVIGFDWEKGKT